MAANNIQKTNKLADQEKPIKLKVKLVTPGRRVSKNKEKKQRIPVWKIKWIFQKLINTKVKLKDLNTNKISATVHTLNYKIIKNIMKQTNLSFRIEEIVKLVAETSKWY